MKVFSDEELYLMSKGWRYEDKGNYHLWVNSDGLAFNTHVHDESIFTPNVAREESYALSVRKAIHIQKQIEAVELSDEDARSELERRTQERIALVGKVAEYIPQLLKDMDRLLGGEQCS